MKTVVGLYDRFDDAQQAVKDLRDAGFRSEDISLIARDASGDYSRYYEGRRDGEHDVEHEAKDVSDGAATGAGIGAVLGGLGGLLVGLGALAIPGIGPVLAAGPLVTALAGAGVGAVAGGMVGALVDLGIPEEHAQYYAEGVRRGGTLVVVRADDMLADQAMTVMNRHNPVDVGHRAEQWRSGNWSGYDPNASPLTADEMEFNRLHDRPNVPVTGAERNVDYGEFDREIPGTGVTGRDLMHGDRSGLGDPTHDIDRDLGSDMGRRDDYSNRDDQA